MARGGLFKLKLETFAVFFEKTIFFQNEHCLIEPKRHSELTEQSCFILVATATFYKILFKDYFSDCYNPLRLSKHFYCISFEMQLKLKKN